MKEKIMEKEKTVRFDKYNSQAMKGIAILLMMFHHMYLEKSRFEPYNVSFAPFTADKIMYIARTFKICVPIYAFITGYGLYLSYKNNTSTPVRWTGKRLMKTMSGFWIIWLFSVAFFLVWNGYTITRYCRSGNKAVDLAGVVIDFLGLSKLLGTPTLNGTWWYMSAAIIFIICVPLFMKQEENLILILVAVAALPRVLSLNVMGRSGIYAFLPALLMGMCVSKYDLFNRWFQVWNHGGKKIIKFLLEFLLVFILYKAYRFLPLKSYSELHWGIYPVVFIAACCEFIVVIPGIRQTLHFLGKHSMNIFLLHTFVRQRSFVYIGGHFILNTMILLLVTLAVSIVLEWFKKISGYNRLIQNISAKIG